MTDDDYMATFKTIILEKTFGSILFFIDFADMSDKTIELKALEACLVKDLVRSLFTLSILRNWMNQIFTSLTFHFLNFSNISLL